MPHSIRKTVLIASFIVLFMFSFSFALSPLYSAFCKATGFNSAVKVSLFAPDLNRDVIVQFVATNNEKLAWQFYPLKTSVHVHPEENMKVFFYAKNTTQKTMTVQAIPSFTPALSAQHFHKIQCFCFNQQTLKPGETIDMPIVFRIDKNLPDTVRTITLAYTLFDVTPKSLQRTAK